MNVVNACGTYARCVVCCEYWYARVGILRGVWGMIILGMDDNR